MVSREMGERTLVAPVVMAQGVGQSVRKVDRRVVDAVRAQVPASQRAALVKVLSLPRGPGPGLRPDR